MIVATEMYVRHYLDFILNSFYFHSVRQDRNWITHLLQTKVSIDHTGVSYWLSPVDFTATCSFDIKQFPYDTQVCSITFGPWSDGMERVRLIANGLPTITKEGYIPNVEWNIVDSSQLIDYIYYTCCPIPFTNLQIYLTLKRKPSFYTIICIVPCLFLLGILFLGHGLPPQSGERITLSMMISLTCILMMEYTNSKILPNTAEIPSLSRIYLIVVIIISLSILTTCFVLTLYHRISVLLWFPRFLEKRFVPKHLWTESILKRNSINLMEMEVIIGQCNGKRENDNRHNLDSHMTMNADGLPVTGEENEKLLSILDEVKNYNKKTSKPEKVEVIFQQRAKHIAIFLDKMFIASALIFIVTAILLDIFT